MPQFLERNCKLYSPDMVIFKQYTSLVRAVLLLDLTAIHSGLWAALTLQTPSGILLPRLTHLGTMMKSQTSTGTSPPELGLLLSTELYQISIVIEVKHGRIGEDVVDFLKVLEQRAPNLRELRLETDPADNLSTVVDCLSEIFGALIRLRVVQLAIPDDLSPLLLATLLHLCQLDDLRMKFPPSGDQSSLFQELPPPFHGGYRSDTPMHNLELSAEARVLARVLNWIGKVNVRSLTHVLDIPSTETDLSLLINSVSATSTPSLDSLTISLNSEDSLIKSNYLPDVYQHTTSTFRPLLTISTLVTLKIRTFVAPLFTDAFLQEAAAAWPSLERLEFCPHPIHVEQACQVRPQVTMPGLLAFVARCPKLSSLGILFDTSTAAQLDNSVAVTSEKTRHLAALDVGHSWVESDAAPTIARVLAKYFPSLKRLSWHDVGEQYAWAGTDQCLHNDEDARRRCTDWKTVLHILPFHVEHVSIRD